MPDDSDAIDARIAAGPAVSNTHALIERAIEKGIQADELNKLLDFAERCEKNAAIKAFSVAMNACQAEMPTIVRDAHNQQTKSNYIKLETLQHVIRPVYIKHGFSLSFSEEDAKEGQKRIVCQVRHNAGHQEVKHLDIALDGIGPKGNPIGNMNAPQASVSTMTYGQNKLLRLVFNITVADQDLDGNTYIGKDQIAEINGLIDEIEAGGKSVNIEGFLTYIGGKGCTSMDQIPAAKFTLAIHELNRKRKAAK